MVLGGIPEEWSNSLCTNQVEAMTKEDKDVEIEKFETMSFGRYIWNISCM